LLASDVGKSEIIIYSLHGKQKGKIASNDIALGLDGHFYMTALKDILIVINTTKNKIFTLGADFRTVSQKDLAIGRNKVINRIHGVSNSDSLFIGCKEGVLYKTDISTDNISYTDLSKYVTIKGMMDFVEIENDWFIIDTGQNVLIKTSSRGNFFKWKNTYGYLMRLLFLNKKLYITVGASQFETGRIIAFSI
jgi:hypothetical protein